MKVVMSLVTVMLVAFPAGASELDSTVKQIVGGWRLNLTTHDGEERTPIIIVGRQHEELVAWYVEKNGLETCKDVHLEDGALVLTVQPQEFGEELTVTFEGRLSKDNESYGEAKYSFSDGESGTLDFVGKRISPADFRKVTRWMLDFTTPDGNHREAVVTLLSNGNGKLYGWYSSNGYELPLKQITLDDERLAMSLKTKTRDGAIVEVTFRGTIEGNHVRGDAEYDLEGDVGSFAFSGRLEPEKSESK